MAYQLSATSDLAAVALYASDLCPTPIVEGGQQSGVVVSTGYGQAVAASAGACKLLLDIGVCSRCAPVKHGWPRIANAPSLYLHPHPPTPLKQVTLVFRSLNLTQWLVSGDRSPTSTTHSSTYSELTAAALGEAAGTPPSAVRLLDLRPALLSSITSSRRMLHQIPDASTGVQITLFVVSENPAAVQNTLRQAIVVGALYAALANRGVPRRPESVAYHTVYAGVSYTAGLPEQLPRAAATSLAVLLPLAALVLAAGAAKLLDVCRVRRRGPYWRRAAALVALGLQRAAEGGGRANGSDHTRPLVDAESAAGTSEVSLCHETSDTWQEQQRQQQ